MKLPKGPLKVITFKPPSTFRENELRDRANGKIFHPTIRVAVEAAEGKKPQVVEGFAVDTKGATLRTSIKQFPHLWAVPNNTDIRHWVETTGDVEVITESPTA